MARRKEPLAAFKSTIHVDAKIEFVRSAPDDTSFSYDLTSLYVENSEGGPILAAEAGCEPAFVCYVADLPDLIKHLQEIHDAHYKGRPK